MAGYLDLFCMRVVAKDLDVGYKSQCYQRCKTFFESCAEKRRYRQEADSEITDYRQGVFAAAKVC